MFELSKSAPSRSQGTTTISNGKSSFRVFIFGIVAAISLVIGALTSPAQAGDPSEEYYESLNNASALATSVDQLASGVNSFSLPAFFCKPPDSPQRSESERTLSDWGRQQRRLDRQAQRMSQLAASVTLSLYRDDYDSQVKLVHQILVKLANIRLALKAHRTALQAIPERDCSEAESAAALGSLVTAPGSVADMSSDDALMQEWLTAAQTVKGDVNKFRANHSYCKRPHSPNKQEAKEKLQALERLVRYFDNRIRAFYLTDHNDAVSGMLTMINTMNNTLAHKRAKINRAREVDCAPKQSSLGTTNNQELGYALMDAMRNNPFKRDQGAAPAYYGGYEMDVLYDAEAANRQVTRDILQATRRDQRRQDYDTPNTYNVNSLPIETQTTTNETPTASNRVPASEVVETSNTTDHFAGWQGSSHEELVPQVQDQVAPATLNTPNLELNVPSGHQAQDRVPSATSVGSSTELGTRATSQLGPTVNRTDQAEEELQEHQY